MLCQIEHENKLPAQKLSWERSRAAKCQENTHTHTHTDIHMLRSCQIKIEVPVACNMQCHDPAALLAWQGLTKGPHAKPRPS